MSTETDQQTLSSASGLCKNNIGVFKITLAAGLNFFGLVCSLTKKWDAVSSTSVLQHSFQRSLVCGCTVLLPELKSLLWCLREHETTATRLPLKVYVQDCSVRTTTPLATEANDAEFASAFLHLFRCNHCSVFTSRRKQVFFAFSCHDDPHESASSKRDAKKLYVNWWMSEFDYQLHGTVLSSNCSSLLWWRSR